MESSCQLLWVSKGVEGLSKKEKGLMNMDNSLVIAGGEGYTGGKMVMKKYNKD